MAYFLIFCSFFVYLNPDRPPRGKTTSSTTTTHTSTSTSTSTSETTSSKPTGTTTKSDDKSQSSVKTITSVRPLFLFPLCILILRRVADDNKHVQNRNSASYLQRGLLDDLLEQDRLSLRLCTCCFGFRFIQYQRDELDWVYRGRDTRYFGRHIYPCCPGCRYRPSY